MSQVSKRPMGCIQTGPLGRSGGSLGPVSWCVVHMCGRCKAAIHTAASPRPAQTPSGADKKGPSSRGGLGPFTQPQTGHTALRWHANGAQSGLWPLLTCFATGCLADGCTHTGSSAGAGHVDACRCILPERLASGHSETAPF